MKSLLVSLSRIRGLLSEHPMILVSLCLGLVNSPFLWFSGVFVGKGEELLGGLLFLSYTLVGVIEALIYWVLIFRR